MLEHIVKLLKENHAQLWDKFESAFTNREPLTIHPEELEAIGELGKQLFEVPPIPAMPTRKNKLVYVTAPTLDELAEKCQEIVENGGQVSLNFWHSPETGFVKEAIVSYDVQGETEGIGLNPTSLL